VTARYRIVTIVLENDVREDAAEVILTALRQIRGVAEVIPQELQIEAHIARAIAVTEIRKEIYAALANVFTLDKLRY
jgi:hypothetical protein